MSLAPEADLDSLIIRNDSLSGAVIAAIMQEAGLRAVRKTDMSSYKAIWKKLTPLKSRQIIPSINSTSTNDYHICFNVGLHKVLRTFLSRQH